jgi:probable HAF family extracellular repeat protein
LAVTSHACGQTKLELLDNSPSLSQAIDINRYGHIIGLKDVTVPKVGFMEQSYFWDGQLELAMPDLTGYTNTQATALADNGLVVGYAARAPGDGDGNMEACLWNTVDNAVIGLGRLEGHGASHAFDISADGSLVVGYSSGRDPTTMVPVVWQRSDGDWHCQRLSTIHDFNPYLLTARVVISGDGSKIAACITVRIIDRPIAKLYESSTFLWQRDENGTWQREKLSDHQLRLGDINDAGMLTGSCLVGTTRRGFVITPQREFQLLEPLEGDDATGGTDVNNEGTVVGYSDDPQGPEGGPTAFLWRGGNLERLEIPGDPYFSWAAAINDAGDIAGYLTPRPEKGANDETKAPDESEVEQTVSFVLKAKDDLPPEVEPDTESSF